VRFKVDLIMFDFDGTIVDSKYDIATSANHVLSARGLPEKNVELIASYIGNGIHVLMGKVLGTSDGDEIAEGVRTFREHYWDHCLDRTSDYPGVRDTLEQLRYKTKAVVTNKPKRFTDKILEGLSLADFFVRVVGGDGEYAKKPSPEAFLAVLDALEMPAGRALVVGDSANDVNGGRAAGCMTCAVTYGLSGRSELEAASPDAIIDSMAELPGMID
jgi:phosphoglycolate phosphatase